MNKKRTVKAFIIFLLFLIVLTGCDYKSIIKIQNNKTKNNVSTIDFSENNKTSLGTKNNDKTTISIKETEDLSKAEIVSSGNIVFDKYNGYLIVPNITETIRLNDVIKVSPKAIWSLCTDIYGENTIKTKICTLNPGDNKFYIVIESGDQSNINTYELTIRRREIYTISFNTYNGTKIDKQFIEEDNYVSIPNDPKRSGYSFDSWNFDFENTKVTSDILIDSKWNIITYTISYNLNGGINNKLNPTTYSIEDKIKLLEPTREYYTFKEWTINKTHIELINGQLYEDIELNANWERLFYVNNSKLIGLTDYCKNYCYEIVIPDSIISIENHAFSDCSSLQSITIPESVVSIGRQAFYNCSSLQSITIPEGVTTIEKSAFNGCYSLQSITIPDSVTSIGDFAFSGCPFLRYNEYNDGYYLGNKNNPYLLLIKSNSEYIKSLKVNDKTKIIYCYAFSGCSSLQSITIPDSVTTIGNGAFNGCSSLQSITIPDSVTTIGQEAFYNCSSLQSITIPDSVTSIGNSAFSYCSKLSSITIPDSVKSIGSGAFYYCFLLKIININSINFWFLIDFGDSHSNPLRYANGLYLNGELLNSITIPNNITSIGNYTFYGWSSLQSIAIPDSVTSIGDYAFTGCSSLTSITIPDSVSSIGNNAFTNCSSLVYTEYNDGYYLGNKNNPYLILVKPKLSNIESFNINYNTSVISGGAFYNCSSLQSITIPDSITSIGNYTFYNCSSLQSITIPDSVTSIGTYAFYNCSSLQSITIPDSVLSIGSGAFLNCSSLQSIKISNNLMLIDDYTFRGCSSLTSIIIPNSVITIGYEAFSSCSSLQSITIPDSVTSIGNNAFNCCSMLTSITIPNSVNVIEMWTFSKCLSLASITIPNSVVLIGNNAFSECCILNNVYYIGTQSQWNDIFIGCDNYNFINANIHYNYIPEN